MSGALWFILGTGFGALCVGVVAFQHEVIVTVLDWFSDEHDVWTLEDRDPLA